MTTKVKDSVKKVNKGLVNASIAAINTTVANGEKWQKLSKKLIKKSEPVRTKQMNMVLETATAVKNQATTGAERMMDLVGYDASVVDKAINFVTKNPVSKKVMDVAGDVTEMVTKNPMVKKVEKTTDGIKKMSIAKYNDVKEDVLEQATKILKKGEELVEDAKEPKKVAKKAVKKTAKKTTAKKTTAKKTVKQTEAKGAAKVKATKKTIAKKATATRKTTAKKVAAVEAVAKKTVKAIKNQGTENVADVLVEGKKKVTAVKKATVKAVKNDAKDDLQLIHGIGPKLETVFNKNGMNTYADLAKAEKTQIEKILDEAGPMFKNTDTADWKKQAEVGAEGGAEALKTWVARYRTA